MIQSTSRQSYIAMNHAIENFDVDEVCRISEMVGRDESLKSDSLEWHYNLVQASFSKKDNGAQLLRGLQAMDQYAGPPDPNSEKLLINLLTKGNADCVEWSKHAGPIMGRSAHYAWMDYTLGRLENVDLVAECRWTVSAGIVGAFNASLLAMAVLRGDGLDQLDDLLVATGTVATKAEIGSAIASILYRRAASYGATPLQPSDEGCQWLAMHCPVRHIRQGANAMMMDDENKEALIKPLCNITIPLGVANYAAKQLQDTTPQVEAVRRGLRI